MPLYRVGKYRFNTPWLISTEDLDGGSPAAMRVTMFPGEKYDLGPNDADELGRKLDGIEGQPDAPIVGGAVLASFDPATGLPLRRPGPGTKDVPGA